MRQLYEWIYRIMLVFHMPVAWVFGRKTILTELVESGRIPPGRAIDLGCGAGLEVIFLAQHGFDAVGVDLSPTALRLARRNARRAGVSVTFYEDDLTHFHHLNGTFDLLTDFGALTDLTPEARDAYVQNVLSLIHGGSQFLLMVFEKNVPEPEIRLRFGERFTIEEIGRVIEPGLSRQIAIYLMVANA